MKKKLLMGFLTLSVTLPSILLFWLTIQFLQQPDTLMGRYVGFDKTAALIGLVLSNALLYGIYKTCRLIIRAKLQEKSA